MPRLQLWSPRAVGRSIAPPERAGRRARVGAGAPRGFFRGAVRFFAAGLRRADFFDRVVFFARARGVRRAVGRFFPGRLALFFGVFFETVFFLRFIVRSYPPPPISGNSSSQNSLAP